ncbi:MAG TPA: hypothetical protein VFD30_20350 [Terriglobia bacterium]|nr:hypothetical protein [Terriglobia bacterium]
MKPSPRALLLSLLTAGSALLSTCDRAPHPPAEPAYRPKVVFVLFDLSASTEAKDTRERYLQDFQRIVDRLQPADLMVADEITDNPLARSTFPLNEALIPPYDPLVENPRFHEGKLKMQKEAILAKARKIVLQQNEKFTRTKILDSLQLAERVFTTYRRDRRVLVLFSDMIEESEYYNFLHEVLTPQRVSAIIAAEKSRDRLPALNGVRIYVVGAAAGIYRQMTSERFERVRDFWLEYFRACGADLSKERYGSVLLEAPE